MKKQKRQFHSVLLDKIDALAGKNPKRIWKLVNSIKASQTDKMSNEISSFEWFEYFKNLNNSSSIYTEKACTEALIVKDFSMWASGKNDILDEHAISADEVCRISKKLKNRKACGSDSFSNEIIKLSVKVLPSHFVKLFNVILSKGVFPLSWSKGFIVPIYKVHVGSMNDPNNYRARYLY